MKPATASSECLPREAPASRCERCGIQLHTAACSKASRAQAPRKVLRIRSLMRDEDVVAGCFLGSDAALIDAAITDDNVEFAVQSCQRALCSLLQPLAAFALVASAEPAPQRIGHSFVEEPGEMLLGQRRGLVGSAIS